MRAVLDPNVLISALLSPRGAPAELLRRWLGGGFEFVVSELLLAELSRALAYPRLRERIPEAEAAEFVAMLAERASTVPDPDSAPARSPDPGDDYLLALAEEARAVLVTGDRHLLELSDQFPIRTARELRDELDRRA